jgi:hypothetical protein
MLQPNVIYWHYTPLAGVGLYVTHSIGLCQGNGTVTFSRRRPCRGALRSSPAPYVGVDMALKRNVAVVLGERAEQLARFAFSNDREGYEYFHRRLERLQAQQQAHVVLIGMEPTNYFWKLLATDLEQRQADYRLVNSYTVKKHREGDQLDRAKDDNRDAFTIGDLLRTGKYTETQLLHGDYAELRQHVVLYHRLRDDMRRQKTLIRNTAGQLFPEFTDVFKDLTADTALAMLRHHAAAHGI